jgi:peptidoglycan/LPS O-acetylase OafA/YrhL
MKRSNAISLVQILFALWITNWHTRYLEIPYLSSFAKIGWICTMGFVFISGYLLTTSFTAKPALSFWDFIKRRFTRLYPSYHVALLVIGLIYLFIGRTITIKSSLLAITGFQYYFGDNTFGLHLWFVSVILVCYLLFIPTYKIIKRYPLVFFLSLIIVFLLVYYVREGSLDMIYTKNSEDIFYRFIFHYIVFCSGIYMSTRTKEVRIFSVKIAVIILILVAPVYWWTGTHSNLSVIAMGMAFVVSLCVISLTMSVSPFVEKHFPQLFYLASIPYELYLIHYSVIDALNHFYHGAYLAYPAVFIISILLAFAILMVSRPYSWLIRRITDGSRNTIVNK